jgi:hypothetical protein
MQIQALQVHDPTPFPMRFTFPGSPVKKAPQLELNLPQNQPCG